MEKKGVTFVLFGGTGDLIKKKLVPAIADLVHNKIITNNSTIIGISRKKISDEEYKDYLISSSENNKDKEYIKNLDIKFFNSDFANGRLKGLNELMKKCEIDGCNRIYYLSTSFKFFPSIVKELKKNNLEKVKKGFTRIVFEKPFGKDLKSSEKLDKEIHKVFPEESVFRLDHYLAKRAVIDLSTLKLKDSTLRDRFNRDYVESIEIIVEEDFGAGERIGYYNDAGAIKDMIQGHLLQVLSLVLIDLPKRLEAEKIHENKVSILRSLEILGVENHLLGQYESYRAEAEKAGLESNGLETFARIALNSNTKRWSGVKLILRTGKKLNKRYAQIKINFKPKKTPAKNIIIDINPKQNDSVINENEYAVLLEEVVKGDKVLFASSNEIRESWKIIDKIEKIRDKIKFIRYKNNSDPEEES